MWLKPGSNPLSFTAQQTIAVADVGFLWRARFRMAGTLMQIIDYLVGGEGGLQERLVGALPVVSISGGDATFRGTTTNQGSRANQSRSGSQRGGFTASD